MLAPLGLLGLLGGAAAAPPYNRAAAPRFPIEGGGSAAVMCDTRLKNAKP